MCLKLKPCGLWETKVCIQHIEHNALRQHFEKKCCKQSCVVQTLQQLSERKQMFKQHFESLLCVFAMTPAGGLNSRNFPFIFHFFIFSFFILISSKVQGRFRNSHIGISLKFSALYSSKLSIAKLQFEM